MKRILLASAALIGTAVSAQAADMAVKAPYLKAPVVAVYNWTGFYMGVNAGVGIGRDRVSHFPAGDTLYQSPQGGFGGAQIGYNWQADSLLGPIVYGIEADIQGGDISGGGAAVTTVFGPTTYNTKSDWFGTVRGRLGLATGPVLSYVTAGYAYGNVRSTITEGGVAVFNRSQVENGWTVGSGVEAALGGNWTGKLEYLYLNLGDRADAFGPGLQFTNNELRENIFRAGLNYRIGGNAAYASIPASNWTGWYLGGNVGSGTGRSATALAPVGAPGIAPETFSLNQDGINGGGQIGYNWQAVNWVYGIETDIQASSQRDNRTVVGAGTVAYDSKLPWFGTVRGRLGYSVGSSLFYVTGGYAYGGVKNRLTDVSGATVEFNKTQSGWTAGAGIETPFKLLGLFGPQWTSKTEYLYVDLGNSTNVFGAPGALVVNSTNVTEHIFRTGLNYHFNSPVVAKY